MIELYRLIGIRFTTNDDAMGLIWYPSVWESTVDAMQRYGRIQQFIYYPLCIFALRLADSWIYDLLHYGTLAAAHVAAVYAAIIYLGVRFAALFRSDLRGNDRACLGIQSTYIISACHIFVGPNGDSFAYCAQFLP